MYSLDLPSSNLFQVYQQLGSCALYLSTRGFVALVDVLMPVRPLPRDVMFYLTQEAMVAVAMLPTQVTSDLGTANVAYTPLSSARLRDKLREDAVAHCQRLHRRFDLLMPLLTYCTADLETTLNEGEFTRKKAYGGLAGVPLLPMADGSIKVWPRSLRDRVVVASPVLHALLPQLRSAFVHLSLLEPLSVFRDPAFRDKLYVSPFNAAVLVDVQVGVGSSQVVPLHWRRCGAVVWKPQLNNNSNSEGQSANDKMSVGRGVGTETGVSELLVFALWRDVLALEPLPALTALADWPLTPVLSRGRRMLVSPALLPYLFLTEPTSAQDARRAHLQREAGRLAALVSAEASEQSKRVLSEVAVPGPGSHGGEGAGDWGWTSRKAKSVHPGRTPVAVAMAAATKATAAAATAQTVAQTAAATESSQAGQNLVLNENHNNNNNQNTTDINNDENVDGNDDGEGEGSTGGGGLSAIPLDVLAAMVKLGVPFLDGCMMEGPPAAFQTAQREVGSQQAIDYRPLSLILYA